MEGQNDEDRVSKWLVDNMPPVKHFTDCVQDNDSLTHDQLFLHCCFEEGQILPAHSITTFKIIEDPSQLKATLEIKGGEVIQ